MLYSYFFKNIRSKNRKLFIFLLILTIFSIIIMQHFDSYLKTDVSPQGIVSLELAKDLSISVKIIETWEENEVILVAGLSTGFDFLFLVIYTSFISLLILLLSKQWKNELVNKISKIIIWTVIFAAFLDIIENLSMIKLFLGDLEQKWVSIAFYAAFIKFSIILISLIYILSNTILFIIKNLMRKSF